MGSQLIVLGKMLILLMLTNKFNEMPIKKAAGLFWGGGVGMII